MGRTDPDKHAEQIRVANRARAEARNILIDRHRDEYDALYAETAKKYNVTPKPRKTAES